MPRWKADFNPESLYFVTTTAVRKAHIFRRDVMKRILIDSLSYMRTQRWTELYAFVVMPNHLHFIARCLPDHPLADVLRDFKKHTAKQTIRQYQAEGNQKVLAFLAEAVPRPQKQRYKVWDDDYDAKEVFTPEFLKQKMDYIHNNPLQPHWCLAERAEEYPWSSARFFLMDEPALIALDDARKLMV